MRRFHSFLSTCHLLISLTNIIACNLDRAACLKHRWREYTQCRTIGLEQSTRARPILDLDNIGEVGHWWTKEGTWFESSTRRCGGSWVMDEAGRRRKEVTFGYRLTTYTTKSAGICLAYLPWIFLALELRSRRRVWGDWGPALGLRGTKL
jgi:hypothetical protein